MTALQGRLASEWSCKDRSRCSNLQRLCVILGASRPGLPTRTQRDRAGPNGSQGYFSIIFLAIVLAGPKPRDTGKPVINLNVHALVGILDLNLAKARDEP